MASAFYEKDKRRWRARFYGPFQRGATRRTVIIPAEHLRPGHEKASADAYAAECDRLARLCENPAVGPQIITRAAAMQAVTAEQARALRAKKPVPVVRPALREGWTITEAAESHPSTARETKAEQAKHRAAVARFTAWSGAATLGELTLDLARGWIAEMERQGLAWDTRRHSLLWLRRASRMAGAAGLPDPLSDFVLDRRGRKPGVQVWTLDELCAAGRTLRTRTDLRPLACLLLGGFLGLRPSEIARARIEDIDADGVLEIGKRHGEGKNAASRRRLPMPPAMVADLRALAADRPADQPLIAKATRWAKAAGDPFFCLDTLGDYMRDHLMRPDGPLRPLPPKCLRKSFATWATRRKLDRDGIEAYLGHDNPWVPAMTRDHYLGDLQVDELRPFADEIGKALSPLYGPPSKSVA